MFAHFGMDMSVNDEQPLNEESPTLVHDGSDKFVNAEHLLNAEPPTLVHFGSDILVNDEQPLNAELSNSSQLEIVISVTFAQSLNAPVATFFTLGGNKSFSARLRLCTSTRYLVTTPVSSGTQYVTAIRSHLCFSCAQRSLSSQ